MQLILKTSVVAVAAALASPAAFAQAPASQPSQTVYITGSNLKRVDKEGTSPVQVVTAQDIKDTGAQTVQQLMRFVPAIGSDSNYDSTDGGFSRGVATASLRGLSSTSTLILLNGRRMTPSAYADPNDGNSTLYDLNSIPISALDRVEILKDGASAVYGSDAIGGVINFITKSNYQGAELSARYSANDDGEFARRGASGAWGKGDLDTDGYNVFVTVDVSKRDRTALRDATDIAFEQYQQLNGRFATPYGSQVSQYPTFYRESAPGSRNFGVTRANADQRLRTTLGCDPSEQLVGTTQMGFPATSVWVGRTFCNYDLTRHLEAQSAGKDAVLMSRGVLKLGANARAFAEVAYARSERNYTGSPLTLGQSSVNNFTATGVADPFQAILEIGHPDNPFPNARASVGYRFVNTDGGTDIINKSARLLVGAEGDFRGWSWDTGLLWNRSEKEDTYRDRLYLPTLRKLNTGTTLAQLAADPTLTQAVTNTGQASILQWDAKANTQFGQLPGGPMGLALGVELRREKIKLDPTPDLAAGNIYALVNSIIDGERDVKSAFVELRTPILKNLEMDFAGRADKYPSIKTNYVPKVGFKWTAIDGLAFRGTYAKGFRAPALVQVTPGGSQVFLRDIFDRRRCEPDERTPKPGATEVDCAKSAAGTGGANPDLVPEKSRSYSLGLIYSPSSSLDFLVEYFRIRKEGEVVQGSAFEAIKNEDRFPENVVRDQNPANFVTDANGTPIPNTGPLLMVRLPWENQGSTEVRGIDFEVRHRARLGEWGALSSKLNGTYMTHYSLAQHPGDIEHNVVGGNAGIYDWNLSSSIDVPRLKFNLASVWTRGDHAVNASVNYVGSVSLKRYVNGTTVYEQPFCHYGTAKPTDAEPNRNGTVPLYEDYYPDCKIDPWVTVGLGYTYTGFKNLMLSLNIQNLFDKRAPYDPGQGISTSFVPQNGYNEGLHNNYGRYFTVSARYTF
ncbi:iron complex outermembrane receptor protein [Pseudoduganella flava]|uniref:Iron complex outermembrane receptor protein n=1 Tax=Pseudoduganella flava TaxID=871742 RepID=A0A562PMD0_9BURK|nr:TonB-dependent receptor [Pseudoduganella flava]QGZ40801.1 TonB-dependent receptor [Pseudoduganella flava]TWI45528.1 iron complex outermembrane receptor protein [Pseudoduganella flava]